MRRAAAVVLLALAGAAAAQAPVRGIYAEGKNGLAWIVPCGSGKKLELMDSDAARELRKLFATLGAGRVKSMFVEVTGERHGGDAFGAATVLLAQTGGLPKNDASKADAWKSDEEHAPNRERAAALLRTETSLPPLPLPSRRRPWAGITRQRLPRSKAAENHGSPLLRRSTSVVLNLATEK